MKNTIWMTLLLIWNLTNVASGQFQKNTAISFESIAKGDLNLIVEQYVRLPNEVIEGVPGRSPRINTFASSGNRNFVGTEDEGNIYEIFNDGTYDQVVSLAAFLPEIMGLELSSGGWHGGLRGLAFHPDFEVNGKFYISFMGERPENPDNFDYLYDHEDKHSSGLFADAVVAELTYDFNQSKLDESSYRQVIRIGIDYFDHTIKQIGFNPFAEIGGEDYGLLYIAHGDSGVQSAPPDAGMANNPFGKILCINPLISDQDAYSVPATNPFINDDTMMDEVYALGFRNPHHFSFNQDQDENTYLISADTGRDNIEEINIIKAGENYGWAEREGTFVFKTSGGLRNGIEALPDNEVDKAYTYPAVQWIHSGPDGAGFVSQAIAGGHVVDIDGELVYIHAEFAGYGRIFYSYLEEMLSVKTELSGIEEPTELTQAAIFEFNMWYDQDSENPDNEPAQRANMKDIINDDQNYDNSGRADLRFGRDNAGNTYITSKRNGWIYKVQKSFKEEEEEVILALEDRKEDIVVFPNPLSGSVLHFKSSVSNPIQVSVTNSLGDSVYNGYISNGRLENFHYPNGVYFITFFQEGVYKTLKIVKND